MNDSEQMGNGLSDLERVNRIPNGQAPKLEVLCMEKGLGYNNFFGQGKIMKGPTVKRDKWKVITGCERYVRNNPKPRPQVATWRCPKGMRPYGRRLWEDLIDKLKRADILAELDRANLELLCNAWSELKEAEEILNREGRTVRDNRGSLKKHPIVTVYRSAAQTFIKLSKSFGLNPGARARLGVTRTEPLPGEDLLT